VTASDEWAVWFNGEIVPEREARVPFRDRGFKYGDAVFDTTRTFGHRVFRLEEHIARLFKSLAYLGIDPGLSQADFCRITEEVAAHNLALTPKDEDIWVTQRVSRGIEAADRLRREFPAMAREAGFPFVDWTDLVNEIREREQTIFAPWSLYVDHAHLSPAAARLFAQRIHALFPEAARLRAPAQRPLVSRPTSM